MNDAQNPEAKTDGVAGGAAGAAVEGAVEGVDETPSIIEEEPDTEQAAEGGETCAGPLEDLLDGLTETGHDQITIEDIVESFEHRSIGALVSVIALISSLPLVGGLPGVTMITATLILLVIGQSLVHRRGGIWVPGWLGRRSLSAGTVEKGVKKARPVARHIDRWMYPRLEFLTVGRTQRLGLTVAIVLLTLSFYPLNFIPWAVTAPSFAVLALGLALMTGDGYLALIGCAMAVATVWIGYEVLSGGLEAVLGDDGGGFLGLFGGGGD